MSDDSVFPFDKFVSNINDPVKSIRCDTLNKLERYSRDDISKLCSSDGNYVEILIELLNDEAEICRQKSLKLCLLYIRAQNVVKDDLFISFLLAIDRRMGKEIIQESSEEIRCLFLQLLSLLLSKCRDSVGIIYFRNTFNILLNSLNDPCPETKECGFILVTKISAKFSNVFSQYSNEIVPALLSCTRHKLFRVRKGAVDTLKVILQCCSKDVVTDVCCSLGGSSLDQNWNVRISVLRAAAYWIQSLPDRHSYTHRLLPLILISLVDESAKCREEAYDSWSGIGLGYATDEENSRLSKPFSQLKCDGFYNFQIPNDGCRTLIKNELHKLFPVVIEELDDWRNEVRIRSAKLLKIIIIHAGASVTPFLDLLIPALSKKCCDQEDAISKNIIDAARLVGGIVPPYVYWKLISSRLEDGCTMNHLVLLSSLLKMSEENQRFRVISEVARVLVNNQTHNVDKADFQKYLLKIFSKILHCCADNTLNESTVFNVYSILLSSMALVDVDSYEVKAFDSIGMLCSASEFQSTTQMNERFFGILFPRLLESCTLWRTHYVDFKIYTALLRRFADDVFMYVPDYFIRISQVVLHYEFDKETAFNTLLNIAKLMENDTVDVNKHVNVIERFLLGSLTPVLIWRSGKVVAVVRHVALIILNLYLQRVVALSSSFIEQFTPSLISLCEDDYKESRRAALHALAYCSRHLQDSKIEPDIFVKILTAAVARLQDECVQIRIIATSAVKQILFISHHVQLEKNAPEFQNIRKAVELLIVMSSDENNEIRNALKDVLQHPTTGDLLKALYSEEKLILLASKFSDQDFIDSLRTCWKI